MPPALSGIQSISVALEPQRCYDGHPLLQPRYSPPRARPRPNLTQRVPRSADGRVAPDRGGRDPRRTELHAQSVLISLSGVNSGKLD